MTAELEGGPFESGRGSKTAFMKAYLEAAKAAENGEATYLMRNSTGRYAYATAEGRICWENQPCVYGSRVIVEGPMQLVRHIAVLHKIEIVEPSPDLMALRHCVRLLEGLGDSIKKVAKTLDKTNER